MSRYIDEDMLYSNIEEKYKVAQGDARRAYNDVLDTICEIPTADVAEVTRCKYCKFYRPYNKPVEDFDGRCFARECETDEYDFCSYGKKMDEEEQK